MSNKPEFTEEQIKRLDELIDAAMTFLKVLGETDDIPEDIDAVWNVIYEGKLVLSEIYQRRVRIPSRVTLKDGTSFIAEYEDEIDCELVDIEECEHM